MCNVCFACVFVCTVWIVSAACREDLVRYRLWKCWTSPTTTWIRTPFLEISSTSVSAGTHATMRTRWPCCVICTDDCICNCVFHSVVLFCSILCLTWSVPQAFFTIWNLSACLLTLFISFGNLMDSSCSYFHCRPSGGISLVIELVFQMFC